MNACSITAVLLAAGRGRRFGGNKLEAMLNGTMLGLHAAQTLAGMKFVHLFAVHDPGNAVLANALATLGFKLIDNNNPDAGLSHSLALAANAAAATDATAMLIALADMPFVTSDHLTRLIESGNDHISTSAIADTRMPPALFPRAVWPALTALTGDTGARKLLSDAISIQASPDILADIDTRADLDRSSQ